ncbi:MAG TPA: MFS transporter, partial [Myxococcota bacterium]|nr:MFS transporter [Myxococcota bacterium]
LASAPLLALFSLMAWVPPGSIEGAALIAWIAVAIFGFYTAYTMFEVPHMALGAELTLEASARNRVFGIRQALKILGMLAAGVVGTWAVERGVASTRVMAIVVSVLTLGMIVYGVSLLPPERAEYRGRGGTNPFRAVADVLRNRHARLLLAVIFIDGIGAGGIGVLTPFVLDYVVGAPPLVLPALMGAYMLVSLAVVPVWVGLARRYAKKRLMLISMLGSGIGYGMVVFAGEGDWLLILVSAIVAGAAGVCPNVLGYTIKSEIIDWDEHATGERKEGAYFAGWSFVSKLAAGVMIGIVGWALEWAGFDGSVQEQTELVKRTMVLLMGGFPLVCFGLGAVAFSRFELDESEHARIRAELDARARTSAS